MGLRPPRRRVLQRQPGRVDPRAGRIHGPHPVQPGQQVSEGLGLGGAARTAQPGQQVSVLVCRLPTCTHACTHCRPRTCCLPATCPTIQPHTTPHLPTYLPTHTCLPALSCPLSFPVSSSPCRFAKARYVGYTDETFTTKAYVK